VEKGEEEREQVRGYFW